MHTELPSFRDVASRPRGCSPSASCRGCSERCSSPTSPLSGKSLHFLPQDSMSCSRPMKAANRDVLLSIPTHIGERQHKLAFAARTLTLAPAPAASRAWRSSPRRPACRSDTSARRLTAPRPRPRSPRRSARTARPSWQTSLPIRLPLTPSTRQSGRFSGRRCGAARKAAGTGAADRRASLRHSGRAAVARDGCVRAWAHPRAGAPVAGAGAEAAGDGASRPRSGAACSGWRGAGARGGASAGVRPPGRRRTGLRVDDAPW